MPSQHPGACNSRLGKTEATLMFKSGRRGSAAWDGAYVRNVRAQLEDGSMGLQGTRMPPGFAVLLRAQSPIAFLRSKMMTTHLNIPVSSMPLLMSSTHLAHSCCAAWTKLGLGYNLIRRPGLVGRREKIHVVSLVRIRSQVQRCLLNYSHLLLSFL